MLYVKLNRLDCYEDQKQLLKKAFELYSKLLTHDSFGQYKFEGIKIWNTPPISMQDKSNVIYEGTDLSLDDCFHILDKYKEGSIRITFHVDFYEPKWVFDIDLHIERKKKSRYCDFHINFMPYALGNSLNTLFSLPRYFDYFRSTILKPLLDRNPTIAKYEICEAIPTF